MIIIGEKINGSIPAVADAIAKKDGEFIKHRAEIQANANATFIDCCAGLINSVSMESGKIDTIFPVIADTKWQVVALLCDDKGIPTSVERRMEVFHQIMDKAKEYGIAPSRIHIDPLVVTLSTDETALTMFADCCRRIKAEYPDIHITSGLSNISFGLPARKNVNQAFMVLAMNAGMDSAIVDPTNTDMLGMVYATEALLENDEFCLEYINAYRAGLISKPKKA